MPEGDCELRIELIRLSDSKWFSTLGDQPLVVPVTIGQAPSWSADYVSCDAPTMLASGQDYAARVRVHNSGNEVWAKGLVKLSCKLFRVSNYTHDSPEEIAEEVPTTDIRAQLAKACKPGEVADFVFDLNLRGPDKKPVLSWRQDNPWSYQLRFDIYNGANWLSELGVRPLSRAVDVFDADYGVRIADSNVPKALAAGQTFDAMVVIKNNGVHVWDRKRTRVGYHWYHVDGTQMQWDCPTTAISQDIKPGWPAVARAKIKAPEYDGQYVLVWDVTVDGQWLSTMPLTRGGDVLPVFVQVTRGKLAFVDLSKLCDVSAISPDTNRTTGDFDGKGSSFPAEYVPPDAGVTEEVVRVYPSGYKWDRETRPEGRISFLYPEKTLDGKTAIACGGQKVVVEHGNYLALHVLGASSNGNASGEVSLNYSDGAESAMLAMSDWGAGPAQGEAVGCAVRHRHSHGGDEIGKFCYLYHYTVPLNSSRTLTSVTLPRNPDMKITAITLERVALP
jgi:hypothetical protein